MPVTITFVHGTWAAERIRGRDRPHAVAYPEVNGWPLATALRARYPTAETYLLRWSGGNSVRERRRAAAALVRHVRAVDRRTPGGVHMLVGHSHGGSVACYALSNARLRRRLSGVVCLSTPFVTFSRRPTTETRVLQLALFLVALMTILLLSGGGDALWVPLTLDDAPAPPSEAASADPTWQELVGVVVLFAILIGGGAALKRMDAAGARFLRKAALPDIEPVSVPLMLIRSPRDEASGSLATSQFIAWVLLQFLRTIVPPHTMLTPRKMAAAILRVMLIVGPVVAAGAAVGYVRGTEVSLPVVPIVTAMLLLVPVLMLAFSGDIARHALFVHTSVEPCPPGRWEIHQLGPDSGTHVDATEQPDRPGALWRVWRLLQWNPFAVRSHRAAPEPSMTLMHSITYQDARAVELVIAFVESRIAAASSARVHHITV